MLRVWIFSFSLLLAFSSSCCASVPLSSYNEVWQTPSDSPRGSMPVGSLRGGIAGNVFVNATAGYIQVTVSHSSAWSESNDLIKLGVLQITLTPNPWGSTSAAFFSQELDVATATVFVRGGTNSTFTAAVWASPNTSNIVVNVTSSSPIGVEAQLLVWRNAASPVSPDSTTWNCYNYTIAADTPVVSAQLPATSVASRHDNGPAPYWADTLQQQDLTPLASTAFNPLSNRTLAIAASCDVCTRVDSLTLRTAASGVKATIVISGVISETAEFDERLGDALASVFEVATDAARASHVAMWNDTVWSRARLDINPTAANGTADGGWLVARMMVLHRLLINMQVRAPYPIKFNGMLFNVEDPIDYRKWAGANWWQNMRLPYYALAAQGAEDGVAALLSYFNRMLPLALARTKRYFNHTGVFWPETHHTFGTYAQTDYGCADERQPFPPSIPQTRWNRYNLQGSLDLALLVLDALWLYARDAIALAQAIPLFEGVVDFYAGHWGSTGLLRIFPTNSLETWQCITYPPVESDCVVNDMPTVAGITYLTSRLLAPDVSQQLPERLVAKLVSLAERVPPLPIHNGMLWPGDSLPPSTTNSENTELYAVHPYRLFTVGGGADLNPAMAAYKARRFPCNDGWCQDIMDAALLGIGSDLKSLAEDRATSQPLEGYRFPAFQPAMQDYAPNADHLSNLVTAVQGALLQHDDSGEQLVLFPAWPCAWDIDFLLQAPNRTTVSGRLVGGRVEALSTQPAEALRRVRVLPCQQTATSAATRASGIKRPSRRASGV
eukprot:gnl/Spiro4/4448_TR2213_c0_g1_i1.p1 gnl/Spiro4/4448_TR2213_c0_g1~~gnl/Spiro4/4448_TR2213_c0_g1_i1.p1  ORF type:complete len:781 (-),score=206.42 gnl/Spiro4/4448_TR2213_c0_g1_i1:99-2441(-)